MSAHRPQGYQRRQFIPFFIVTYPTLVSRIWQNFTQTFTLDATHANCFVYFFADGDPHKFRRAVSRDVAARGVSLDDAADQAHGGAVGQRHPLPRHQTKPPQPQAQEGESQEMWESRYWLNMSAFSNHWCKLLTFRWKLTLWDQNRSRMRFL